MPDRASQDHGPLGGAFPQPHASDGRAVPRSVARRGARVRRGGAGVDGPAFPLAARLGHGLAPRTTIIVPVRHPLHGDARRSRVAIVFRRAGMPLLVLLLALGAGLGAWRSARSWRPSPVMRLAFRALRVRSAPVAPAGGGSGMPAALDAPTPGPRAGAGAPRRSTTAHVPGLARHRGTLAGAAPWIAPPAFGSGAAPAAEPLDVLLPAAQRPSAATRSLDSGALVSDIVEGRRSAPPDERSDAMRPPVFLSGAAPLYPELLASRRPAGRVAVDFVVDTLGTVAPGSLRTIASTHPLFAAAVRSTLARWRFTPAESAGRPVERRVAMHFAFAGGTTADAAIAPDPHVDERPLAVFRADEVDEPVAVTAGTPPRYPELLTRQALTGRVLARFVVDTLGQLEPASLAVVQSTDPVFTRAVLSALPHYRFSPAEVVGRRVRQQVELPFVFRPR